MRRLLIIGIGLVSLAPGVFAQSDLEHEVDTLRRRLIESSRGPFDRMVEILVDTTDLGSTTLLAEDPGIELQAPHCSNSAPFTPLGFITARSSGADEERPWRLQHELQAAGAPEWLRISGQLRVLFEGTVGQFRAGPRFDDDDGLIHTRVLLAAAADFDSFVITAEGVDSRELLGDEGSALNTAVVDTVELLQAHLTIRLGSRGEGEHELRIGRQTIDLGSRRLVARNLFRNTINAFTGIRWQWRSADSHLTALYTLPTSRLPNDLASIVDNKPEFDEESFDQQFFGVFFESTAFDRHRWEIFGYGLLSDGRRFNDRDIGTIGGRFYLPARESEFDYEIDAALQFGRSRISSTGRRLDHIAGAVHFHVGYTFDAPWKPHVRLALDFASGDDDPGDGNNNRFDTLFGQPREFGPTNSYTLLNRANILSPELRVELRPRTDMSLFFGYRLAMLASERDAWTTPGIQDPAGNSGRIIGHQFESRWRWELVPDVVRLESGLVYLVHGEFQDEAPGARGRDTFFGYMMLRFTF